MNETSETAQTRVFPATDEAGLAAAIEALQAGQLVAFPTDTVYGVGCDLWQPAAIERIYWAKLRPRQMAIPVLVSSAEAVAQVAEALPAGYAALAQRFWPGALTLVVPRRAEVPAVLAAGGPTVAVRIPDHPVARRLIAALGGALAVTSANLSGRASPVSAGEVLADLAGRVAVVLDGGPCPGGVASSIIDLTADPPVLLRAGALSLELLREVLPHLVSREP